MVEIIHNPRCSKSRMSLEYLKEKGVEADVRLYLKDLLSEDEIRKVLKKLGISAFELLRKGEADYKELVEKNGEPDEDTLISWMCDFPKLIERPIIVNGEKAVIGRPKENIDNIL